MDPELDGYIRTLRHDYLGEVVGEVDHRIQSLVALDPEVRHVARELARVEVTTRRRLGEELARVGAAPERAALVRAAAWTLLLPVKLVLPTRAWVALLHSATSRAVPMFERQRARFGARNPDLFDWLIAHEVRQRDWAGRWLRGVRGPLDARDEPSSPATSPPSSDRPSGS
jgi:hypothetical protein